MGNILKRKQHTKVICVGLDNSGKSSIINSLKPPKRKKLELNPTVGFQAEEFIFNNVVFDVFDMSGQNKYRNLWEYYYDDVDGIIFVVDSSDVVRFCVVKDELDCLLSHEKLQNRPETPILICCNKKDLPNAADTSSISNALSLSKLSFPNYIIASNGLNGEGLKEGLEWLSKTIDKNQAQKNKQKKANKNNDNETMNSAANS